jgi:hypothetical protein
MCPHSRMRTPIFYEIYSVSDTHRTVQQGNYTIEEAIRDAFATFFSDARVKRVDADALGGGTFTFRMYGRVPIIAFTEEDDETVYFSGDRDALQRLVDADVEKIDDLLEKPRDAIGGRRRKRMLHKHTPLSRRTKRSKHFRKSKRARRTLRKK